MTNLLHRTPRQDGFRMPIESDPHEGCWMLFPYRPDIWRENALPAQRAFAHVAATIAQFEPVIMGVLPELQDAARRLLPPSVKIIPMEYEDGWVRDSGATFVVNDRGEVRGVDWIFNAWGGLYTPYDRDDALPQHMLELTGFDRYRADFVLEGGSIHTDGDGTLYTTKECLLNPNRNPQLSQAEIEQRLLDYVGVEKVVWIKRGVYKDETSGHVDNLCAVIRPAEVVLTWTDDAQDPQYDISREAYEFLMSQTDAKGRQLRVHKLHQPSPMYMSEAEAAGIQPSDHAEPRHAGDRLAGSYVNFYVVNGGVVVPQFDDPHDAAALQTLQALFPDRRVVGVAGREILLGGGNVHCITQQQPKPQIR